MLTLNLINEYLCTCEHQKGLNSKTIKAYRTDLFQLYSFISNEKDMLSKTVLKEYIQYLHQTFHVKTVKRKIASMNAFFNYLTFEEKLNMNPLHNIQIKCKEPKLLPKTISISYLNLLFQSVYNEYKQSVTDYQKFTSSRNIAILELLISTGLRISELCTLSKENICMDEKYIKIFGKGSKERILYIGNDNVYKSLLTYMKHRDKLYPISSFFFINKFGHCLSDQSVRSMISTLVTLNNIPIKITPHMFRHTFASLLLEEDVDIRYIQHILGHSSITTTQIYTHIYSNKQRNIMNNMNPSSFIER